MAGFYGGYMGNAGALAQGNLNPLTDPRFKIPGGAPWGNRPLLPDEKETFDRPFTPLLGPGQNVPLAQGFAGEIGNMAGMAGMSGMSGMSGMEGAQLAGGPFDFIQKLMSANKSANQGKKEVTGLSPIDKINANRAREMDELRKQGLY